MSGPIPRRQRNWHGSVSAPQRAASTRRTRLVIVGVVLCILLGIVIAWLCSISPHQPVYFLPLALGEYGERFPIRRWVSQDRDTFGQLRWDHRGAFTIQERALIEEQLRELSQRKLSETVVVYLSAYARCNDKGELCLLPVDSQPDRPSGWIPVEEVIAALKECPAKHKLLLVDLAQTFVDLRRGILLDDAASQLRTCIEQCRPGDSRVSVLTACSAGQVSLTSEELGQSVFAHYLCRGLRGLAHNATGKGKVARVSLQELATYVTREVDDWAIRNHGLRQTPQLLGSEKDFTLVQFTREEEDPDLALSLEYPRVLRESWEQREGWWAELRIRRDPALFGTLDQALLRAEEQWRGGWPSARVSDTLAGPMRRAKARRQSAAGEVDLEEPGSVAAALDRRKEPLSKASREAVARDLRGLLTIHARSVLPKAEPSDVKLVEPETEAFAKKYLEKPLEVAVAILDELADGEERLSQARVLFLSSLLNKCKVPGYSEVALVRQLARLPVPEEGSEWPVEGVRVAMQGFRTRELVGCYEARQRDWVDSVREPAEKSRLSAVKLLGSTSATQRLEATRTLKESRDTYRALLVDLEQIREAQQALDEALILLPGYAGYLEWDPAREPSWYKAVEATCRLREIVREKPQTDRVALARQILTMAEWAHELRNGPHSLGKLREPLEAGALEELIRRRERPRLSDLRIMNGWQFTSWPTIKQRLALWQASRAAAGVLEGQTSQRDRPTSDSQQGEQTQQRLALRRARWSIELLKLHGSRKSDKLQEMLDQVNQLPLKIDRFRKLAGELHLEWTRSVGGDRDDR